jgi:hypothetical protein
MRPSEVHSILEASYPGMIGIEELLVFYQKASKDDQSLLQTYLRYKKIRNALDLIQKVTGVRIKESANLKSFKSYIQEKDRNAPIHQ